MEHWEAFHPGQLVIVSERYHIPEMVGRMGRVQNTWGTGNRYTEVLWDELPPALPLIPTPKPVWTVQTKDLDYLIALG